MTDHKNMHTPQKFEILNQTKNTHTHTKTKTTTTIQPGQNLKHPGDNDGDWGHQEYAEKRHKSGVDGGLRLGHEEGVDGEPQLDLTETHS